MRMRIVQDELYPFYRIDNKEFNYSRYIELTEEEIEWVQRTLKEFEKVQDFLEKK